MASHGFSVKSEITYSVHQTSFLTVIVFDAVQELLRESIFICLCVEDAGADNTVVVVAVVILAWLSHGVPPDVVIST